MKNLFISILISVAAFNFAQAEDKIKMYFNNEDVNRIIEIYSKASGQKFVVDPSVRGKASVFIQEPITLEEAFNQLSTALAINGYVITKEGDTMVVRTARNSQRGLIETGTELPV